VPDFGIKKKAYRPLWQDTPGYKTVVDQDSQLGIFPAQFESPSNDKGQGNADARWPVDAPQSHEKQRALPLPSNHDKKREKRIGPTTVNKPRKVPDRTLSIPGEQYGHPTKYDYNMPTRRHETLAGDFEEDEDQGLDLAELSAQIEDIYEEDPIDDQESVVGGLFPKKRQKSQGPVGKRRSRQWYLRNKGRKLRTEKKEYNIEKRRPRTKLKQHYRDQYENRYERRGIDPRTPAQKSKAWRAEHKEGSRHQAGMELLGEVMEMLGGNWPADWNTTTKKTGPPDQLDRNFGKGQNRDTGTPRTDNTKQEGESLRAPDLSSKEQKGLKWDQKPPASGGFDYPEVQVNNPTGGSGKVMPMQWYTQSVNNTQAIPDGRQDRYLRNNNFDVKQATAKLIHELTHPHSGIERTAFTVNDILKRCDKKIKQRSKKRIPKLSRIDTKNWIWTWKSGDHTVKVQAFKRGNSVNFPKLNLRVSCSCPFWRWWGPEHWGTKSDYQKGKLQGTAAYPKVRDPARWRPVCKHAYGVLEKSQDFFVRPKKSPLRKLGSRFFVDSPAEIEIELVSSPLTARVAQRHLERQISRRVARRYFNQEES